jgi:hypothetical protein
MEKLKAFWDDMTPADREVFAERCGTSVGHLRNLSYGYRTCAESLAIAIERESGGLSPRLCGRLILLRVIKGRGRIDGDTGNYRRRVVRVIAGSNLTLELEPGLLQRFRSLRECVHWTVLNDSRGLKAVAADCDISVSELSRRLHPSEGDPRSLDVDLFVQIMRSTRDLTPLHWLMACFLEDENTKRRSAVDQLTKLMPQIAALLADAGAPAKGGRRS